MELRQLRYFVKAAELHNFSEASKAMFVTQSTLSQQIKQLEEELGVQLFRRNSHDVSLTEEGMQLLPFARETINSADNCVEQINELKNLLTGTLYIGVTYTFSPLLTETMLEFSRKYPKVKLHVFYKTMTELMDMLQHRELDFVLAFKPTENYAKIESQTLFKNRLCVVVNENHPLARKSIVTLEDLQRYDLAMPARGLQVRNTFDEALAVNADIQLRVHIELNDVSILLKILRDSNYVSVLAEAAIHDEEGIVGIPLAIEGDEMEGCMHFLKNTYAKNATREFCNMLSESIAVKKFSI